MLCVCEPPHEVLTLRVTPFDFSFVHCKPVVPIPRWAPNLFFAVHTNSQSFVSQNCQFSFRNDGWSAATPPGPPPPVLVCCANYPISNQFSTQIASTYVEPLRITVPLKMRSNLNLITLYEDQSLTFEVVCPQSGTAGLTVQNGLNYLALMKMSSTSSKQSPRPKLSVLDAYDLRRTRFDGIRTYSSSSTCHYTINIKY